MIYKNQKTYGDKVFTNFLGLNVSKDDIEYKSCAALFFYYLLVYENKVYLDNGVYKIVSKEITDYLGGNLYEN